jgi:hypothetical protein
VCAPIFAENLRLRPQPAREKGGVSIEPVQDNSFLHIRQLMCDKILQSPDSTVDRRQAARRFHFFHARAGSRPPSCAPAKLCIVNITCQPAFYSDFNGAAVEERSCSSRQKSQPGLLPASGFVSYPHLRSLQ